MYLQIERNLSKVLTLVPLNYKEYSEKLHYGYFITNLLKIKLMSIFYINKYLQRPENCISIFSSKFDTSTFKNVKW